MTTQNYSRKTRLFRNLMLLLILSAASAVVLSIGCSKGTDDVVDDNANDKTPPATVTDMHVISVTTTTAKLGWTAPGDDGAEGLAHEYDLRGSLDSITEANFAQGYPIDSAAFPIPGGLQQECTLEDLVPGTTYFFAMKARDDAGNWSGLSNCVRVDCPADIVVSIPDAALDSIVRDHIGKPTGDLHISDVDSITELGCDDAGITDLTGLEYFTGMGVIGVAFNDITDLTPLENMAVIWGLNVTGNPLLTDLSPVASLTTLAHFSGGQTAISDISPLANLTHLEQVALNDCDVTDFSPLYNLPVLESLNIESNALGDISFMANLTHLKIIGLSSCQISDISPLAGLTGLERIYLFNNQIVDLTALENLTNLIVLDLNWNSVEDLQPLVDNAGLGAGDFVYLQNNPLTGASVAAQIQALQDRGVTVNY